jgi:hypothetical protein
MYGVKKDNRGFGKIDVAIFLVAMALICVVAVPRYDRFEKTAEAKSTIHQLNEATRATLEEYAKKNDDVSGPKALPTDEELIRTLKKHLGGSIPENPFTKSSNISLQHHRAMGPCDTLEAQGGWIWNLIPKQENSQSVISKVWLNSDTVNISNGRGESCIQP